MPAVETLLPFLGISLLLALAPGPDNIFVLLQSAMYGVRPGLVVVLGLCTGLLIHTAVVSAGLGTVLAASPTAFAALKVAGAAYLVFLAWQAFRAPVGHSLDGRAEVSPAWRSYARGIIMNLTNPKVVIFFLAFLPQFVVVDRGMVTLQLFVLGVAFTLATMSAFSVIAWCSSTFGRIFTRSPALQRGLNWFAGSVFLVLAARLAITRA